MNDSSTTTKIISRHVSALMKAQDDRIAALEAKVAELEKRPSGGLTKSQFTQLAEAFKGMLVRNCQPWVDRVKALEARPAGSLTYAGTWDVSKQYRPGEFVTHGGSMWHSNIESLGLRPGVGGAWTLAVKRGADGRDADHRRAA